MGIQEFKSVALQWARLVGEAQKLDQWILNDYARLTELLAQIGRSLKRFEREAST